MPSVDIEQVKDANPIQDVIGETEPLRTERGRYVRAQKHDSLVVDVQGQYYSWNSKNETGDVVDWLIRYRNVGDFKGAVEWLCRRGGLPSPEWNGDGGAERIAARAREDAFTVYARWAVHQLRESKSALTYARGRGWTDDTIRAAGLGFSGDGPKARKDLLGEFSMHGVDPQSDGARAVLSIPPGMLVYPHVRGGRVRYLSARGVAEKRHYNVAEEHAGPRQPYANSEYAPGCDVVMVVEGQADAVTVGQWGYAAIALAGTALSDELVAQLQKHRLVYWATDADAAGEKAREQARRIGPLVRLLAWPAEAKDANAWLVEASPTADDVRGALKVAPTLVEWVCECAGKAGPDDRDDAILDAMRVVAQLPKEKLTTRQDVLVSLLGIKKAAFNGLLKTLTEEAEADAEEEEKQKRITLDVVNPTEVDGWFLDTLYHEKRKRLLLAVRDPNGGISVKETVDIGAYTYQAGASDGMLSAIQTGTLLMPSDVPDEETNVADLHTLICKFTHRYLDVDEGFRQIAAYYVMLSWVYDCFREIGFLRFIGPYGKGKSRAVNAFGYLMYRPLRMAGMSTLSPLFRAKAEMRCSICVDELNAPNMPTDPQLEAAFRLMSSSMSPGIMRTDSDGKSLKWKVYGHLFGPAVFGAIDEFSDPATKSRCLTYHMTTPTNRDDIPVTLEPEFEHEAQRIRNLLMRFRMRYWRAYWPVQYDVADGLIEPRLRQITASLKTIIPDAAIHAHLAELIREQNAELVQDREYTLESKIVRALLTSLADKPFTPLQPAEHYDVRVAGLARSVKSLVFDDEDMPAYTSEEDQLDPKHPRNNPKHWANRAVTPKKVGSLLNSKLGLKTRRSTNGNKSYIVVMEGGAWGHLDKLKRLYGLEAFAPAGAALPETAPVEIADLPLLDEYLTPADDED